MQFLKKIFGLNGKLDRRGYLFLGVFPTIGLIFLLRISSFSSALFSTIIFGLVVSILMTAFISSVKRGRDSGLNGLVTLLLFGAIPVMVIVLNEQVEIDIFYLSFSFIAYLLLMPSSSQDLKIIGKIEYVLMIISMLLIFPLLLATLIVPTHTCAGEKAKIDLVCVNMRANANALKMFKLDNAIYPSTEEGNAALVSNPNVLKYPNYAVDAYLDRLPKDSWGAKMVYVKTKDGFDIISYGADRKEGGEDEYTDIFYSECK